MPDWTAARQAPLHGQVGSSLRAPPGKVPPPPAQVLQAPGGPQPQGQAVAMVGEQTFTDPLGSQVDEAPALVQP